MAAAKSVWGIDVGQCALKALKLRSVDGQLQVEAFDVIEHPKMLCQGDPDQAQLIQNAIEQFLARNSVVGCQIAIAVPGRSSFTRFVKLPPVEPKKIPDIVRFEAEQQIPFPIDEVTWRWQAFQNPNSPDVEVGLFAMKRVDIDTAMEHFAAVELDVDVVQMAPLALYNFMARDNQISTEGATLLADVGVDKTDLVVADGSRIWTRTIQIGGRNFTEALEKAFKLSFNKAEKLKKTAATNKYARQVFQAMRPVFADLVQEIQRSIGYYTSLHRETRFAQVLGLGNGFRLPGLQKFLQQSLGIPVSRVDSYNCLTPSPAINAPVFTENVLSFGVAYGLALQGLDEAPVYTNLLPEQISRRRRWNRKKSWFAAAAAVLLLVQVCPLYRALSDRGTWAVENDLNRAAMIEKDISAQKKEYKKYVAVRGEQREQMAWYRELFKYRDFLPSVQDMVSDSIRRVATDQWRLGNAEELAKVKRTDRKIIIVERVINTYIENVSAEDGAAPARQNTGRRTAGAKSDTVSQAPKARHGVTLRLEGRTPLSTDRALTQIITPLMRQSRDIAAGSRQFEVVGAPTWGWGNTGARSNLTRSVARGRAALLGAPRDLMPDAPDAVDSYSPTRGIAEPAEVAGPDMPDPLIPTEDMSKDTLFWVEWVIAIEKEQVPSEAPAADTSRQ